MKIKLPFLKKRRKSREQAARERIQRKKIKLEELDLDNRIDKKLNPAITQTLQKPKKSALKAELERVTDTLKTIRELQETGFLDGEEADSTEDYSELTELIKLIKPDLYKKTMEAEDYPHEDVPPPTSITATDAIISKLPDFVVKQVQNGQISKEEFEKLALSYSDKIVKDVYKKLIKG